MQAQDLSTLYTVSPIKDPKHQKILDKWVNDKSYPSKTSLCRFYLRGICVMKNKYCKFAHGMNEIADEDFKQTEGMSLQQRRKIAYQNNAYFNQNPLFTVEAINYSNLYAFQIQHNIGNHPQEYINSNQGYRNRLRVALHEYNWQLFMDWLQTKYPEATMLSIWVQRQYNRKGFTKPHTHCKWGHFINWLARTGRYFRYVIVAPPLFQCRLTFIVDLKSNRYFDQSARAEIENQRKLLAQTGIQENASSDIHKQDHRILVDQYLCSQPNNLKTSICKFYIRGVCLFDEDHCHFCHSFDTLRYEPRTAKITNVQWFEQKALFKEKKHRNYPSFFRYQNIVIREDPTYELRTQKQINVDSELRKHIFQVILTDLYRQFLGFIENTYPEANMTLTFVQREFVNVGLNKSAYNKLPELLDRLQKLGYGQGAFVMPPLRQKRQFIFKMPPIEKLDSYFSEKLEEVVNILVQENSNEMHLLTEANIRKKFYEVQQYFTIPLHTYLKIKGLTIKQWLELMFEDPKYPKTQFDFADKLDRIRKELVDYFNSHHKSIHNLLDIELEIRQKCENCITNYLTLSGLRIFLIEQIISLHKRAYLFPFNSQCKVVDKRHKQKKKQKKIFKCICKNKVQLLPELEQDYKIIEKFKNERVVVVNDRQTCLYARLALQNISMIGVDLQGSLRKHGYIDLVQIGLKNKFSDFKNQILVFDIFVAKKEPLLYKQQCEVLCSVLGNSAVLKIMHDCRQDSVALHQLLGSCLLNVLDTCGMHLYLCQKELYDKQLANRKNVIETSSRLPGLNIILQKYGSPNGINNLKEKMKVRFDEMDQIRVSYFEARPINPEFLEYSVRDVEDLVDVAHNILKLDTDGMLEQIGKLFSTAALSDQDTEDSC